MISKPKAAALQERKTIISKEAGTVWWKQEGWNFEFGGSSGSLKYLQRLAENWTELPSDVPKNGHVRIFQGNRFQIFIGWDADGIRHEIKTYSIDGEEIINVLRSFRAAGRSVRIK